MISFANNNYCEFCFEPMNGQDTVCPKCGSIYNPATYPGTLPLGSVLNGRFYVGRVLGKGGFGVTYLCLDMKMGCRVAIKEYFPEDYAHRNSGDKTVYEKQDSNVFKKGAKGFYNEAKILSRFKESKRIVSVEKLFVENNTAYFVMEYLVGKDLRKYINSIPRVNENLVIYIGCEVLKGLAEIHTRNILHRDIAPDNIYMCDNGEIKLIDFGASRITVGTVSNSLALVLKPGFAPFEQYQTKGNQGPWTDIYALGATLYYLLKKTVPPDAVSRLNNSHLDLSGISPRLARIIAKMMAVNPQERYTDVREVFAELSIAQNAQQGLQQNHTPPQPQINKHIDTSIRSANEMYKANNSVRSTDRGERSPQHPEVQSEYSSGNGSFESDTRLDLVFKILLGALGGLVLILIALIIVWLSI